MKKYMLALTFASLWVLALGSFTSTSLLALVHVFVALPCFYFLFKAEDRRVSKSMWALAFLSLIIVLSVAVNPEMNRALRNAFKVKYFVFGFLSVFAYREFFKDPLSLEKMKWPFRMMLIVTTIATISGIIGLYTGYNPLRMQVAHHSRNSGMFGMLMTYAYGLSLYLVCLISFWFHRRDLVYRWMPAPWFFTFTLINLVGLYLTYTRGAYLGLLIALPFLLFKKNLKVSLIAILATVSLGAVAFFTVPQVEKAFTRRGSDAKRLMFYEVAVLGFQEKPLLGFGYRNFEPNVTGIKNRANLPYPDFSGHAHNNFLEHLASTGISGGVAYLFFIFFWAWEMFRRKDIVSDIGFVFVVSFSVSGLFQYTFGDAANVFFIMGVYALTQVHFKQDQKA